MKCPFCGGLDNKVTDSRLSQGDEVIRRRRECEGCGRRFTTYERIELVLPMVVKKDGRREAFDRLKVLAGLRRACEKRPVGTDALDTLVDKIERALVESGDKEVDSSVVGEQVMRKLRELDQHQLHHHDQDPLGRATDIESSPLEYQFSLMGVAQTHR